MFIIGVVRPLQAVGYIGPYQSVCSISIQRDAIQRKMLCHISSGSGFLPDLHIDLAAVQLAIRSPHSCVEILIHRAQADGHIQSLRILFICGAHRLRGIAARRDRKGDAGLSGGKVFGCDHILIFRFRIPFLGRLFEFVRVHTHKFLIRIADPGLQRIGLSRDQCTFIQQLLHPGQVQLFISRRRSINTGGISLFYIDRNLPLSRIISAARIIGLHHRCHRFIPVGRHNLLMIQHNLPGIIQQPVFYILVIDRFCIIGCLPFFIDYGAGSQIHFLKPLIHIEDHRYGLIVIALCRIGCSRYGVAGLECIPAVGHQTEPAVVADL